MGKVRITGVASTIRQLYRDYDKKRVKLKRMGKRVGEDWKRKSQAKAPLKEGTLVASADSGVIDKGRGRGFIIYVSFDTPYAMRMHESHYRAKKPGRGRKYITLPLWQNRHKWQAALRKAAKS